MHSTAVKTQHVHFQPDVEYDVNVAVLIHYSGRFRERLPYVRRLGLLNASRLRVHVTILASDGDGSSAEEILNGWPPGFDVTFLEMASVHAIPKINGYYFWLSKASLRARWHLRVDDDSATDLGRLIAYADERFDDSPIHLMNSPLNRELGRPIFAEYLAAKDFKLPIIHEYEASLTTDRAMKAVFASGAAMSFLAETGARFCGPGDRALAITMHLCQIPTAACLPMTKNFRKSEFSLAGGPYAHIHYVNWADSQFVRMLSAFVEGVTAPFTPDLLSEIVGKSLGFGRCIGVPINNLTFLEGGLIAEQRHRNESAWGVNGNSLLLIGANGQATTQFHTLLTHEGNRWLIGPYLKDSLHHYLELECCSSIKASSKQKSTEQIVLIKEHEKLVSGLRKTLSSTKAQLREPTYVAELICEIGMAPGLPSPYDKIGNRIEGLIQVPTQLANALVYLSDFPIQSYVELGVRFGWTASFVTAYLSVFNPAIRAWVVDIQPCFSAYESVRRILPIEFILGCAADLDGGGADLCFIDADHSYSAAKSDYLTLGRSCRFCMFHDIHDDLANLTDPAGGCQRLWQEISSLSADTKEWGGSLAGDNVMGIGLVQHPP